MFRGSLRGGSAQAGRVKLGTIQASLKLHKSAIRFIMIRISIRTRIGGAGPTSKLIGVMLGPPNVLVLASLGGY
jgi:hypothetical protein